MSARQDPARRYRMRAPSRSIHHSTTPAPSIGTNVETARDCSITPKSSRPQDNSFSIDGFYLNEHRLCSFHFGGASAPRFYARARQPASCLTSPNVLLREADGPPSEPSAKSKNLP